MAFADDCAVLCGGDDPEEMLRRVQAVLDRLVEWGNTCGLEFNSTKTEAVFFTRTRQLPNRPLTIQNAAIPYRLQVRYLGITLDRRLWWHDHVQNKVTKAKWMLGALLSATRGNWGPRPQIAHWIYTCLLYTSPSPRD